MNIPIPLFDRNQGERQEARCNVARAEEEYKANRGKYTQPEMISAAHILISLKEEDNLPKGHFEFAIFYLCLHHPFSRGNVHQSRVEQWVLI